MPPPAAEREQMRQGATALPSEAEARRQTPEERRAAREAERERIRQERRAARQAERQQLQEERRAARQEERQALRERMRQERREARREEIRERRQALRRELREERRDLRREEQRRERAALRRERLDAWERRQLRDLDGERRALRRERLDEGFFGGAAPAWRGGDRVIFDIGGAALVVGGGVGRLGYGADNVTVVDLPNGWTRTIVTRPNGVRVVTLADPSGVPVRRVRVLPDGERIVLFNNLPEWWGGRNELVIDVPPPPVPQTRIVVEPSRVPDIVVYETLTAEPVAEIDRTYTLNQVLVNPNLRDYMPRVDLDTISFATGSAEVADSEIETLEAIGIAIEEAIEQDPSEVFLVEGHTDAVGSEISNLALSDRRAESVAAILTEYFAIPPENIVTQGFGEAYLKVPTEGPSAENRRVAVRRLTPLLTTGEELAGLGEEYEDLDLPTRP